MRAPKVIMEWLFSAIIVFSLYLLLRGHDSPGGGFAAGIAMSIAILIQYMARGTRQMELLLSIRPLRSEEHTSELQSLMRISYAVFCLKKKKNKTKTTR